MSDHHRAMPEVAANPDMIVVRQSFSRRFGDITELEMHHLVRTDSGVEHFAETHRLRLTATTADWIETTWAVNHLTPFLLTNLLLERLKSSAPARIVTTASDAHASAQIPFDDLDGEAAYARRSIAGPGYVRYGQTKLANILFNSELARQLEGSRVTANCFHPGNVATGITRELTGVARISVRVMNAFSRRPAEGADTLVWLVDSPEVDRISGAYFIDRRRATPSAAAQDAGVARRLWEVSLEQTGMAATVAV